MKYLFYVVLHIFEASFFYVIMKILLKWLEVNIPQIGSKVFLIFLIIWPFIAPFIRPGLHRIPIFGLFFAAFNPGSLSALRKRQNDKGGNKR